MSATLWQKTACILCASNCGLEVQVSENGQLTQIRGDQEHPVSRGYACQKAMRLDFYQNRHDAVKEPMKKSKNGTFQAISWDQAFDEIGQKLLRIHDEFGSHSLAYYGGGGQGNHFGGVYASDLRSFLGIRYVYSALAQEKTGDFWVNGKLFGRQTCHITEDLEHTDCAVFIGTNPYMAHGFPRARSVLNELAQFEHRKIIVIDPCKTETAKKADYHLAVRPGTDCFLLSALLSLLIKNDWIDSTFINAKTIGSEEVLKVFEKVPIEAFLNRSGISYHEALGVAKTIGEAKSVSVRADLGLQQSLNSTLNSYLEKLIYLLTGNFAKKGGNNLHTFLVPLIGHSCEDSEQYLRSKETFTGEISKLFPPNILPQEILSSHKQRIRALIIDSANPLMSAADTGAYEKAFTHLDLSVVIDVAMTETARHSDYILPAASQFEKTEAAFFNLSFPRNFFHLRRPISKAKNKELTEADIYKGILKAMGVLPKRFPLLEKVAQWDRKLPGRGIYMRAFQLHMLFFKNHRAFPMLITRETLGKHLPSELQNAAFLFWSCHRYAKKYPSALMRMGLRGNSNQLGEALFQRVLQSPAGTFISHHEYSECWDLVANKDKKIHLNIDSLLTEIKILSKEKGDPKDQKYPYILIGGERRNYNANTILRNPNWRKKDKSGYMRINPVDAHKLGVGTGDTLLVKSAKGTLLCQMEVSQRVPKGVVSLPNGYGMSYPDDNRVLKSVGVNINLLTDGNRCDPLSKTPFHKYIPVNLTKC